MQSGYLSPRLCEQNLLLSLRDLIAQTWVYSVVWALQGKERLLVTRGLGEASQGGDTLVEP